MLAYLSAQLTKCKICDGTGDKKGTGGIIEECPACSFRKSCVEAINKFRGWLIESFKAAPVAIPTILFVLMALGIYWRYRYTGTLSDQLEIALITGCLT